MPHTGDFIHNCNTPEAIDVAKQDDVVVIGNATDFDGTFTAQNPQAVFQQGIENEFQGTRAGLEGADFEGVTIRGNRQRTTRQRTHYEYIENGS